MKKYQLIKIGDWLGGTVKNGVESGPEELEEFILSTGLRDSFTKDSMDVFIPEPDKDHLKGKYRKTKYLPEMIKMCKDTKEKIIKTLHNKKIPIVLMGDDSSMIGVIAGVSGKIGNGYGILWIDAHGDINTPKTSPSGKIYGMGLAHLLGYGNQELTELNGDSPSLKTKNVIMLGQRSLDRGESDFIKKHNILIYSPKELNGNSKKEVISTILSKIKQNNCKGLFIHVDLDVLDPLESPGVSLKEPNGINAGVLLEIIKIFAAGHLNNLGISIAEYNPRNDANNKTKKIVYEIIAKYINSCAGQYKK